MENGRAPVNTNTSILSQSQHVAAAKQQTPSHTQIIETRPTDFEIGVPVATGVLTIATMGQSVEASKPTSSDSSRFASVSSSYKQVVGVSPKPKSLPEISSQQNFIPSLNGLLIALGALSASYLSYIGISFLKNKRRETMISKEFFENRVVRKMIRENIHPVKFQVLKENFTALRLGTIPTEIFEETLRESLGFNKEEIYSFYI